MKKLLTLLLSCFICFSFCHVIKADDEDIVAKVGDEEFESIQEAIDSIKEGAVRIVKSACESIEIKDDQNITLYLDDGVTLTNWEYSTVYNYGTLTIYASNGTIENENEGETIVNYEGANLKLVSGRYINSCLDPSGGIKSYVLANFGTMTIGDESNDDIEVNNVREMGKLIYNGHDLTIGDYVGIHSATTTINGGTFSGDFLENNGSIFINDGKYYNDNIINSGNISISGGHFLYNVSKYLKDDARMLYNNNEYFVFSSNYDEKIDVENNSIALGKVKTDDIEDMDEGLDKNDIVCFETYVINSEDEYGDETLNSYFNNSKEKERLLKEVTNENIKELIPFDISLYAIDKNDNASLINKLNKELDLDLYLNDETLSKINDNKFTLYKIDDNNVSPVTNIKTNLNKDNAFSFKFDKSCLYALVVYENKNDDKNNENTSQKDTVEPTSNKVVTCEEYMHSKDWTWSNSKQACVYKVTSTSAK